MASLNLESIADFVKRVLDNQVEGEWTDISLPLQEYTFASRWFKAKQKPEKGGAYLKWKIRTKNQENAKHSGLYAKNDYDRKNVLTEAKQSWSKQTVHYIYDVDEDDFAGGPQEIISRVKVDEQGLYSDFFGLMEKSMWLSPESETDDPRPPSGIPFWIQKNASYGFNGGNPDTTWYRGGINTTTYPAWANFSGTYSAVSRDDLVDKVVYACDHCFFKAPQPFPQIGGSGPSNWGFYTHYSVLATMRKIMESQNDNLGRDAAWGANGEVLIKGNPVVWVPALDNTESAAYDSTAPFYGINWNVFEYFFRQGKNMQKKPPMLVPGYDSVYVRIMNNWGNFLCYDLRQNFVFYAA